MDMDRTEAVAVSCRGSVLSKSHSDGVAVENRLLDKSTGRPPARPPPIALAAPAACRAETAERPDPTAAAAAAWWC